jgi:lysine-ketoglutarate reductase/saccharopine dehydrogenase-like protein (TIGR00300 family)
MSFQLPVFHAPDFTLDHFAKAPNCSIAAVIKDGVAPSNYHAMSIYPEYFKLDGQWVLPKESRMDCVAVVRDSHTVDVVEFRNLKVGERVALGRTEDGSEGIYLYNWGFEQTNESEDVFSFRGSRSRETAYSRDYDELYDLLTYEKENDGFVVWVLGPAVTFDEDARSAISSLVKKGYVNALLSGNALGTHDLEGAFLGTALGQDIYTQTSQKNGHYNHLDLLNKVREYGSISSFIEGEGIDNGIIHACVSNNVPFVLAGSIRDDGPLPEVVASVYEAQDAMRKYTRKATTVICLATQLHTIATGNMTPSYTLQHGKVRNVFIYSVDISEFVVNKLRDRGTLEVKTMVTNIQDFVFHLDRNLK